MAANLRREFLTDSIILLAPAWAIHQQVSCDGASDFPYFPECTTNRLRQRPPDAYFSGRRGRVELILQTMDHFSQG